MTSSLLFLMSTAATQQSSFFDFVLALDDSGDKLRAYSFDGSTIAQVGNDFTLPVMGSNSINRCQVTGISANRVVIARSDGSNNFRMGMYEFDGTDFALVGSELTATADASFSFPSIAAIGETRIAFGSRGGGDLRAYDFSGGTWSAVGSDTALSNIVAFTPMGVDLVGIITNTGLSAYSFDGSTWSSSATYGTTLPNTTQKTLCGLSGVPLVYIDSTDDELQDFSYTPPNITKTGTPLSVSVASNCCLAAQSSDTVILGDNSAGTLQAYQKSGATYAAVGSSLSVAVGEGQNLGSLAYLPHI